ncbi:MAG: hypothetical protein HC843_10755 [Sphingomonadales bacterium]|nr:hypothetical protein [Sphingomonadales bacterium]
MSHEKLILAIGRMERALSRLEQAPQGAIGAHLSDSALLTKHDKLKSETSAVLADLDRLIAQSGAA